MANKTQGSETNAVSLDWACVTSDALGMEVEFFEHRYQAENWAEEFGGVLVDVIEARGIGAAMAAKIDDAVDKYEIHITKHVEI